VLIGVILLDIPSRDVPLKLAIQVSIGNPKRLQKSAKFMGAVI
jgi:hypothetical protein